MKMSRFLSFWDPRIGSRVKKVAQDYCFVYNSTRNYTSTELTVHCGSPPIDIIFCVVASMAEPIWGWLRISLLLIRGGPNPHFEGYVGQFDPHFGPTKSLKKMAKNRDFLSSKIGVNSGPTPSSLRDCRTRHFVTHFMHIP